MLGMPFCATVPVCESYWSQRTFKKELTTAVLWLREWELDLRCARVKPYTDGDGMILEVREIVPLPEAAQYQVSIRDEAISRREVARQSGESTGYWFMYVGEDAGDGRSWEDCRRYGFLSAGGTEQYQQYARTLRVGDRVFAYLSGHGYVGVGEVNCRSGAVSGVCTTRAVASDHRVAGDRADQAGMV